MLLASPGLVHVICHCSSKRSMIVELFLFIYPSISLHVDVYIYICTEQTDRWIGSWMDRPIDV